MSISTASPTVATLTRYRYVAVGGETSVSGIDANGNVLSYTAGFEQVYLNGVLLVRGQDYTATNGTSVTGLTALVASDSVEVLTFSPFTITNAVDQTLVNAKGDLLVATSDNVVTNVTVGTNNHVLMADSAQVAGVKYAPEATATLTAKGDLLGASAANTLARVPVGSDGFFLKADSTQTAGVIWTTSGISSLGNAVGKISSGAVGGDTYTYTNTFNPGTYLVTQNQTATVTFGSNTISTSAAQNSTISTTASSVSINTTPIAQWSTVAGTTMSTGMSYIDWVTGVGYVALGTTVLQTSTDGLTWTSRSHPASGVGTTFIASNPDVTQKFIIGGVGGWLASSTDGITWTTRNALTGGNNITSGVRAGNGFAYAIATTQAGAVRLSTDGITWVTRGTGSPNTGGNYIAWGNNTYVHVDAAGNVKSSADGTTWTGRTSPSGSNFFLGWATNLFFIYYTSGGGNTPFAFSSTDGITWATRTLSGAFPSAYTASYIKGSTTTQTWKYLMKVGTNIGSSSDGITWISRNSPNPDGVVWSSNVWVGVQSAVITRSPNTIGYVVGDYFINFIGPTTATTIA